MKSSWPNPFMCRPMHQGNISEKKSINPSIARRLAKYFGMSPDFWMNLQLRWDLYQTQQAESEDLKAIRPHAAA